MENPEKKATFLYVDDEKNVRNLVKTVITRYVVDPGNNYLHLEASDGAEALEKLHATAPESSLEQIIKMRKLIVFTDVNMPGINGPDLIKLIRAIEAGKEGVAIAEAVKKESITERQRLLEKILQKISPDDLMAVKGASGTTRARIILLSSYMGSLKEQADAEQGLRDAFLEKPFKTVKDVVADQAYLGLGLQES